MNPQSAQERLRMSESLQHLKLAWMNYQITRQPRKCSDCGCVSRSSRWTSLRVALYWFRTWERARRSRRAVTVTTESRT